MEGTWTVMAIEDTLKERRHAVIVMGVYMTLMLDLFGSVTSSPQTTELFAKDRKDTLMKYVYLADAGGLIVGSVMSLVDRTPWPLVGSAVVAVPMHLLYVHAAKVGQSQDPPRSGGQ